MMPAAVIYALLGDEQRDALNRVHAGRRAVRDRSTHSRSRTARRVGLTSPEQS